ncbi:uncharacterized protein EV422DRAFT_381047 [Fimicolochytrium jonesii]|uniref:uncharacterized protein n=1 Tax=Fimicolochytrium jonesii TaxID=1396493 RepID=UPI0022FEF6FD|nr:uncharacterized protein EV422DRAFT_381047 [Fimicolochytrium jonesii]KAI8822848.1 hypothetical protein EV422DRAFT_381047 [Fimicolochytrium jonesii]
MSSPCAFRARPLLTRRGRDLVGHPHPRRSRPMSSGTSTSPQYSPTPTLSGFTASARLCGRHDPGRSDALGRTAAANLVLCGVSLIWSVEGLRVGCERWLRMREVPRAAAQCGPCDAGSVGVELQPARRGGTVPTPVRHAMDKDRSSRYQSLGWRQFYPGRRPKRQHAKPAHASAGAYAGTG